MALTETCTPYLVEELAFGEQKSMPCSTVIMGKPPFMRDVTFLAQTLSVFPKPSPKLRLKCRTSETLSETQALWALCFGSLLEL